MLDFKAVLPKSPSNNEESVLLFLQQFSRSRYHDRYNTGDKQLLEAKRAQGGCGLHFRKCIEISGMTTVGSLKNIVRNYHHCYELTVSSPRNKVTNLGFQDNSDKR